MATTIEVPELLAQALATPLTQGDASAERIQSAMRGSAQVAQAADSVEVD